MEASVIGIERTRPVAPPGRTAPAARTPVDPLPLAMLSPATRIGPGDGTVAFGPELVVISEPPPARVLP